MRTSCPPETPGLSASNQGCPIFGAFFAPKVGIRAKARTALVCALVIAALGTTHAQTLARPGWVGSGIGAEAWWRSAVFYRIDVPHFQDSDGDGVGDLGGITERLDYLQSVGVDAIVIPAPSDDNAFDDLLREASPRHIRIIVAFDAQTPPVEVPGRARQWLTRGAAGISIDGSLLDALVSLRDLRALTDSFPGERVLIARAAPGHTVPPQTPAELIGAAIGSPPPAPATPLLGGDAAPGDDPKSDGLRRIFAAQLLTSPGAVALNYGQELGLPPASTMQWTPTNITPPKAAPEPEEAPAKPAAPPADPKVYGAFKPYTAPRPVKKPPPPGTPPDPNSLPGFTTKAGAGDATPTTVNAAVEGAQPNSLLNFYRRLIQLHHDNPSVRYGAEVIFNHDADNARVWIRRAPAGSVTAANVIVTCNLGDKPLTISLDPDLATLHIHPGTLRPLAGSWTATPISQYSNHIVLPPYSVFIGSIRN
ncbi:MAG TPA: hypothetical protein VIJ79_12240 [Acidobacteriaceae bacterium]